MSSILNAYSSLATAAPSHLVTAALQAIVNASPLALDDDERYRLVKLLLEDLKEITPNAVKSKEKGKSRLSSKDAGYAILAVKTLGRNSRTSQAIIEPENLATLYAFAVEFTSANTESSREAIRCAANAILLQEAGRDRWIDLGGGNLAISIIESEAVSTEYLFLASRLLFLTTLKQCAFLKEAVEQKNLAVTIRNRLDSLLVAIHAAENFSKEALTDLLKALFNVMLQYPRMVDAAASTEPKSSQPESSSSTSKEPEDKVLGELWDDKFAVLITPLLRLFNGIPQPTTGSPLVPPLTHVIHTLLNVPVAQYSSVWLSDNPVTPTLESKGHTLGSETLYKAMTHIFSIRSPSPRRSSRSSSRSRTSTSTPPVEMDTCKHAYNLLDATFAHYFSASQDPDSPAVRQAASREGINLDEHLAPILLLITRLVSGDATAKGRFKEWILPADLDRTSPLEKREDLLGRLIRVLGSVYCARLKDTAGELLFTLCGRDSSAFSAAIGYGNAAGYLFNHGILAPPGAGEVDEDVDPITGIKGKARQAPDLDEMTEEEKEREAERLFVLFDRLERTGMAVNPVRKAMQEGRFQDIPEKKDDDSD